MAKKADENLKDKLKSLFRLNKDKSAPVQYQRSPLKDFIFTPEILKDIGPESPPNNRLKTIKELSDVVVKKKLEENAVEAVWGSIQDLVLPQAQSEKRHLALQFLLCLLQGQLSSLGILRGHFFNVLQGLSLPENTGERLALFKVLSENGKNLLEFEEEAGPALLEWMPSVVAQGKATDFLPLLINAIKYNAAYMDEEIISGFVQQTCRICNQRSEPEIKLCLDVLDVMVCYSYLPSDSLQDFVEALCRLVNIRKYCESSWELMRKLLGTHLGHSSIYTMCVMLQERKDVLDYTALRGAIFYIGMALWGSRKVPLLKHTPGAVLPSFLHVLSSGNLMVSYEVILSVQRLVKKYGKELHQSTWDIVLDIAEKVLKQLEAVQTVSSDQRAFAGLHETLSAIENLHETGQFSGSVVRFFKIVEMCACNRPEGSVILLISHEAQGIHPGKEHWIASLYHLMDKYYRNDTRTKVRLKALDVLAFVLSINKHMYEDELINSVVLPHLCHIDTDPDVKVRIAAIEILLGLAQNCSHVAFMDVIGIIEKVMCKPIVGQPMSPYPSSDGTENSRIDESQLADLKTAVVMLVDLFKVKLYTYPPGLCIKLYDELVSHLSAQYAVPRNYCSQTASAIRKCIIECLLDLRADHFHRLGIHSRSNEAPQKFSPFVTCTRDDAQISPPRSPVNASPNTGQWTNVYHLEYTRTFSLFIQALENEKDWGVLGCVLENLPLLLQNKTIILSTRRNLIDTLSSRLCAMVNDRQLGFPEKLRATPAKFTRSDFHLCLFPVLAAVVTFHEYLDRNRQKELIKCLEFGTVSSCAKLCVNALRICTLEMHEVMMRLLPSVLLQLSKISATNSMAIPVLAFLSSIVRCPKMYANFVEDEYMSVFAIALPYTNPFKFSHYTVSLAHHVIAIWFIRCRLPFRKGFVQFIQKGLKANVLQQFEENAKLALQNKNEDSSDRHRSGSYSEAALRSRKRMQSGSAISRSDINAPVDEKRSQFHRELTETCTDIMARYTFGNFSPLPHRSNMSEFLLSGGQRQTWLMGNKLITITTSGSGNKVGNSGVCEKCQAVYQSNEVKDQRSSSNQSLRRRHRSEITISRSSSTLEARQLSSQDDLTIQSKTSLDDMSLEELAAQDASVQTGSSLTEPSLIGNEPLESFILGLKGTDSRRPTINLCNCWCTNWAEIYIRAPSGNLSWMMRIENEIGLYSVQDSQQPDFSMLLASMSQQKRPKVERQNRRIESGSIGEAEYESLYAQHFPGAQSDSAINKKHSMDGNVIQEVSAVNEKEKENAEVSAKRETSDIPNKHQVSEALQIPFKSSAGNHEQSPGSIRRSNSSPSVISCSSDTLSPRDSISDIVQFGPKLDKPHTNKHVSVTKSSPVETAVHFHLDTPQTDSTSRPVNPVAGTQVSDIPVSGSESTVQRPGPIILPDPSITGPSTSLLAKQLSPSPASSETSSSQDEVGELPVNIRRRGHTISSGQGSWSGGISDSFLKGGSSKETTKVGISPSFVFLQLYHSGQLQMSETPHLLQNNEDVERAIRLLDHIYPYETHKIGVIYVGPGQTKDEKAILSNQYGSERYMNFVQSLGSLLRLKDCDPKRIYMGGLSTDNDGDFTYNWQDESIQMVFHIATLMPNKESDKHCNKKKLHIGNDFVTVVYNDSGEDYSIGVIKGQFNYVNIVIKPLDYESNAVTLQAKEVPFQDKITTDIAEILGHKDTKIISDSNLSTLVRQIAIHCNLASMVLQRQQSQPQDPFANNWLERLRKIHRMRTLIDSSGPESDTQTFTEYV